MPCLPPLVVHSLSPYRGGRVALATRHGKERVIGRALRHGLGAELLHLLRIDTDALGSFCGGIARAGSAQEACLAKARAALDLGGTGLAIASEGSFGPHPRVPFLPVGLECMVFLDAGRGLCISEELLARRTNLSHLQLEADEARLGLDAAGLRGWLSQAGFPRHGLMVRTQSPSRVGTAAPADTVVAKGIHAPDPLIRAMGEAAALVPDGRVLLETDMRAHCNPTRMASIRQLSVRLVRRLATPCPACGAPGWGRERSLAGLPCGWCGAATSLLRADLFACALCDHREQRPRADGLLLSDPVHCAHCNP